VNWDAVGAIGEIVGAMAVVASLAYLALQIRAQNAESRAAAMHEVSAGFRDTIGSFADSQIAEIMIKANEDLDSLSDVERFRLITGVQRILRLFEEAYSMYERGRLEPEVWNPMSKQFASFLDAPGFSFVWSVRKAYYNERFQDYVAGLEVGTYSVREPST